MRTHGFSLLELLVAIAILALLLAILLPSVASARSVAARTKCLAQIRALEQAHWLYMSENDGSFITLSHADPQTSWVLSLAPYYNKPLITRSPVDQSPHWHRNLGGSHIPIAPTTDKFRLTSYGVNNLVSSSSSNPHNRKLATVPRPFATIHFVFITMTGKNAGSDHVHPHTWFDPAAPELTPVKAAGEMALHAHGGPANDWRALTNYGFLDGHAESLPFHQVYTSPTQNFFDPALTR